MTNRILYVEDNPDDVLLTELAFRKAGAEVELTVVPDGDKAIAALQTNGSTPLPDCVLLDIKLPSLSGLEVLAWIRNQPKLKRLPVVMLTSSLLPDDVNKAYDLGANSFLAKPSDLSSLITLAKTIDHYWLQTNIRAARPA
ncbi:Response regulator rcp1 [Verrucomicrobia bacterium]|nr:Response regulator rcp1 [Verrucomicrobiota bacterium]